MLSPKSINHKSGFAAYVTPSLQLGVKTGDEAVRLSDYPHIFVVGDAADAFGARKSGSAAWDQVSNSSRSFNDIFVYVPRQAEHAVKNIVRLIDGKDPELESYTPPPPGIKVSLGLVSLLHDSVFSVLTFVLKSQDIYRPPDVQENLREEGQLL